MDILSGLFEHMVLQRTSKDVSHAAITGTCKGTGKVSVRVRRGRRICLNAVIGKAARGRFTGILRGLPSGGPYSVELQIEGTGECLAIGDVLVGDVWLLAGQSNMEGCGLCIDALPPMERVRAFYMSDTWDVAQDPIHQLSIAVDPVHGGDPASTPPEPINGTGLGVSFGQELYRRTGVPQGLIACAHGGTSMAQWSPTLKSKGGSSLYGALCRRLCKNGGRIAGVLWHQGESDCNKDAAPLYTKKMERLIKAFRRDAQSPRLPVVIAQIARSVGSPQQAGEYWHMIREAQRLLPTRVKNLLTVPTINMELSDGIHISGPEQHKLGIMMADAMEVLRKGCPANPPPIELKSITVGKHPQRTTGLLRLEFRNVVGSLTSTGRACGFGVVDRVGCESAYHAELKAQAVDVYTGMSVNDLISAKVTYGVGPNPVCNITDAAGRSLPAFGPLPVVDPKTFSSFARKWQVGIFNMPLKELRDPTRLNRASMKRKVFKGDFADCCKMVSKHSRGVIIFTATLDCAEKMKLRAYLGYDRPVKAFYGKKLIFSDPGGSNPASPDEGRSRQFAARRGRSTISIALAIGEEPLADVFLRLQRLDVKKTTRDGSAAIKTPAFV